MAGAKSRGYEAKVMPRLVALRRRDLQDLPEEVVIFKSLNQH
tara:strand:+ start:741 stop:866 length:126 start_codon:yes stop_codon:yes gene_type:complete